MHGIIENPSDFFRGVKLLYFLIVSRGWNVLTTLRHKCYAPVAQLDRATASKPCVRGSNPFRRAIKIIEHGGYSPVG